MSNLESISSGILYGKGNEGDAFVHNKALSKSEKLKTSCQLFEGTLLRQILNDSLKPMVKGFLDESGASNDIYRSLIIDSLATKMSESGTLGISNLLQAQLQNKVEE